MGLSEQEREVLDLYADLNLPRHTSYAPVSYWNSDPEGARARFRTALESESLAPKHTGLEADLAEIYVHVPFCEKLCLYCACNRLNLPRSADRKGLVTQVIDALEREAEALRSVKGLRVSRVHFGGGTPNYFSGSELKRLVDTLRESAALGDDTPLSIELDARQMKLSFLSALKDCGFQYASLGVQELDPEIQERIGRIQPAELIEETTQILRDYGVSNINFDLIYGLPGQAQETWMRTIDACLAMAPSRFSLFRFALIPDMYPRQKTMLRGLDAAPHALDTAEMFLKARDVLESAGYEYLGLDHFAQVQDPMAKASRLGRLGRSFQGVVEKERVQILGLGPSAVSFFRGVYAQREKDIGKWLSLGNQATTDLDRLSHSMTRFFELTERDWRRFGAIQEIYGNGFVTDVRLADEDEICALHRTSPLRHRYIDQGILEVESNGLRLSNRLGKLMSRLIASHFDDYFSDGNQAKGRHSKAF